MIDLTSVQIDDLVERARSARVRAYAPYSGFSVGAAVRTALGNVHAGCNVENASYGATLCAERVALGCMVAAGELSAVAIAVYTEATTPAMPCGICRQSLLELGDELIVIVAGPGGVEKMPLSELLPRPFVRRP